MFFPTIKEMEQELLIRQQDLLEKNGQASTIQHQEITILAQTLAFMAIQNITRLYQTSKLLNDS